jgi:ribose transport system permease protein
MTMVEQRLKTAFVIFLRKYGTVTAFLSVCLVFALIAPGFVRFDNLMNIIRQITVLFIVGTGLTYVLIAGEIDLSIGLVTGMAGVFVAGVLSNGGTTLAAVVAGILIGLAWGTVNAFIVNWMKIPSFISTLAVGTIARGITYFYTKGSPIFGGMGESFLWFANGYIWRIPVPALLMLILFLVTYYHLNQTVSGRQLYAVGSNLEASAMSGIRVRRVKTLAFAISGITGGFASVVLTARLASGQPTAGGSYLLDGLATAFVGATVVKEGEFHVPGTLVGALIIGVLNNGLTLLNMPYYFQDIVKGVVLIGAVAMTVLGRAKIRFKYA